jgi:hypothetical protein
MLPSEGSWEYFQIGRKPVKFSKRADALSATKVSDYRAGFRNSWRACARFSVWQKFRLFLIEKLIWLSL